MRPSSPATAGSPTRDSLVKLLDGNVPRVALKDIPGLTPAAR